MDHISCCNPPAREAADSDWSFRVHAPPTPVVDLGHFRFRFVVRAFAGSKIDLAFLLTVGSAIRASERGGASAGPLQELPRRDPLLCRRRSHVAERHHHDSRHSLLRGVWKACRLGNLRVPGNLCEGGSSGTLRLSLVFSVKFHI